MLKMRFLQRIVLFLSWIYCAAQDCKNPPPRRATEILVSNMDGEVFKEGTTAVYKCRPGYRTLGSIVMICQYGDWVESVKHKTCQKKPCGHPGDIQFGSFELTREKDFVYGSRVVYKCDEGYQMVSQTDFRDCEADGWSNDIPFCDVIKCLPVTAPKNGMIILSGNMDSDQEFHFGQVVQFECNSNYKLEGPKEIFCSTDGNWNEPQPTCVEISCEHPNLDNGKFVTAKSIYKENERLQYSCNSGFYYNERGDSICTKSGWNPNPSCTEIVCNRPLLANGVFIPQKDKYRAEEEIELHCNKGFQAPSRGKKAKCTSSGWTPTPRCSFRPCEYPEIENGEMHSYYDIYREFNSHQYPAQIGVIKYYRCNHHFRSGHPTDRAGWTKFECTENGWSPTPKCLRQCQLYRVRNGNINSYRREFGEGEQVSIRCHPGFSLENGENEVTCTKNDWSPTPHCKQNINCRKTYIKNGRFSETKDYYNVNEKTRYQCSEGYSTPEGRESGELKCLRSGWSIPPNCIKTCKRPEFRNARYEGNETLFQLNSKLEYECLDGYIRRGGRSTTDSIVCGEDGWSHTPECQEIECYIPDLKPNIRVVGGMDKFKVGDVLSFTCQNKQKRIGPESIQCYHFGWSPDPPSCQEVEKTCGDPPKLDQGDFRSSHPPPYHHGDSVEYRCKEPFSVVGKKTITCIQGNWTAPPQCIGPNQLKKCSEPQHPLNGKIASLTKHEYKHGDSLTYICDANFEAEDSTKIQCINGNWQRIPKCLKKERRKTCSPPPQIPQSLIVSTSVSFLNGETVAVKCEDNYMLQGPKKIKCENGAWKFVPRCIEKKPCSQPPFVRNATLSATRNSRRKIDYSGPKTYPCDTVLKYTCMDGFTLDGTAEITCTMGKWSPPPKCVGLPCGKPPLIYNGATTDVTVEVYQSGEEVTYKCSEGFGISGSPSIKCEGGEWSEKPECIDRRCNTPRRFNKAEIIDGKKTTYMEGDELLYKCLDGFQSEGSTLVTCSGTTWIGDPKCTDHSCGSPPPVQNAVIVDNDKARYQPGERVRYKCKRDLKMFGDTDIVCKNKTWTETPECKEAVGKCGPPPPIDNGDIISFLFAEYPSGAQVEYKCQNLYKLEGSKDVRCENGKWSNPPSCLDHSCGSPPSVKNAFIFRNEKIKYQPGERVRYKCIGGLSMFGDADILCKNRTWTNAPECKEAFGKCGPPPPIDNGDITSFLFAEYPSGAQVEYECQDLYKLEGSKDVRCENGKWSNPPLCLEAFGKCGPPPPIDNGDITSFLFAEYPTGAQVEYECQDLYKLEGSKDVRCENGKWSNPPLCLDACTASSEAMLRNNIKLKWKNRKIFSETGDLIEFTCKMGFMKAPGSPPFRVQCLQGKLTYPECVKR
uniref:Sushi domain-containing protein n=1 Tax=Ornithorhynchus anatinus TaxID=9258 RepID=A0A6I8N0T9_ORNAN